MKQNATPEPLLTPNQVQDLLAVNARYVRHLVDEGRLPVIHLGKRTPRFRVRDVERLLEHGALREQ